MGTTVGPVTSCNGAGLGSVLQQNYQGFSRYRQDLKAPLANQLESGRTDREPVLVLVTH